MLIVHTPGLVLLKSTSSTFIHKLLSSSLLSKIIEQNGEFWDFNEGCLSIPEIREDVSRKEIVKINFLNQNFEDQTLVLKGIIARVVQHEYDHLEGILFTDRLSSFKKRIIKGKK